MPEPRRVSLFGVQIDALSMQQAVDRLATWAEEPFSRCRYVVTPNVDHVVMLQKDRSFLRAYHSADMVVADGWPVVWASRLLGRRLPGLVPGSDLTPGLFRVWATRKTELKVFLLGAMPGVAEIAAANIENRYPRVRVVDVYSPPLGFEYDEDESSRIVARVNATQPDVLVFGVGAPKQETWIYRHRNELQAKVGLCVGATIDFLAGAKQRAPRWMRATGLEWAHRVASEPQRLFKRYLRDAQQFPQIVAAQLTSDLGWTSGAARQL